MKKFTKFSAYLLVLLMLAALLSGCLSAPAEQSPGDVPPHLRGRERGGACPG